MHFDESALRAPSVAEVSSAQPGAAPGTSPADFAFVHERVVVQLSDALAALRAVDTEVADVEARIPDAEGILRQLRVSGCSPFERRRGGPFDHVHRMHVSSRRCPCKRAHVFVLRVS